MEEYKRICPQYGKELTYSCKSALNLAIRKNSTCIDCKKKNIYYKKKYKNNAKILLDESLTTYYWIGFILADGSIKNNKRIVISLKKDDKDHLEKFKQYVKSKTLRINDVYCSTSLQDSKYIPVLCEKFDISHDKTKVPPKIEVFKKLENDKILSLIIGFIDGDGCIKKQTRRKDFMLTIKNHCKWVKILEFFDEKIENKNHTRINNRGYAVCNITNTVKLKELKKFAIDKKLPILERKWDIINLDFCGRTEIAENRKKEIKKLYDKGYKILDISKKLNLKYSTVYNLIYRNKNYYNGN